MDPTSNARTNFWRCRPRRSLYNLTEILAVEAVPWSVRTALRVRQEYVGAKKDRRQRTERLLKARFAFPEVERHM